MLCLKLLSLYLLRILNKRMLSNKLHEAIAIVLTEKINRTATIQEIADEINSKNLYQKQDGSPVQPGQIRLRTHPKTKSGGHYSYMFEYIEPNKVKLKQS